MAPEPLKKLQQEIEKTQASNDEQAASMADLRDHIQRAIDEPENAPGLLEALRGSFAQFQADHPQLAAAIQSAVDFLAESGV
ncbi:MAG: DUF4404 family protein [Chloroflexi bacterium]|jgi:predicted transcriptional regulator|nr:MAG: hypothetical protein UZ13_03291 [Chloroflexi bacterium OLB13]MBW7880374.1 DUF4404 family protein [Anaerolineae bacterium]MCC6565455.1 DUF4404 family protein [Chloroflexota bacterium]MCO6444289.1 DUF4404 family protein [Anaerolineae bacterium]MEB2366421.1 DUF4404 family protein [Chloroflexota bacterium]